MQNQSAYVTLSSSTSSVDCESRSVSVYGYGDDRKSTWRPVCLSVCLSGAHGERATIAAAAAAAAVVFNAVDAR